MSLETMDGQSRYIVRDVSVAARWLLPETKLER